MRDARTLARAMAMGTALMLLGTAAPVAAQSEQAARPCRYRLFDVGTLGGSLSLFYDFDQVNFDPSPFNDAGELAVTSLTAAGFASGALWSGGALTALPNLPDANVGGGGSNANGINALGVVVGVADDGVINPLNGHPYDHAVLWDARGVERLQELAGTASWGNFVTGERVVVGYANDGTPDPYTYAGTQTHAAVWRNGAIQDLGTLGGTDSAAFLASRCSWEGPPGFERLDVIGTSSLDTAAGAPFGLPQTDAFVWSHGVMTDLGGLGGNYSTPSAINCLGEVAVISFDASNAHFQSFVWAGGHRVLLEKLGGDFVEAAALNDASEAVGAVSDASDANALAAAWGPSGKGRLLGVVAGDTGSVALGVNAFGVVVGGSGSVGFSAAAEYAHAFVVQPGGDVVDLNTLVPAGSPLTLQVAYAVNDRGEIAGFGTDAAGDTHAFILVPDDGAAPEPFAPPGSPAVRPLPLRTNALRPIHEGLRRSGLLQ